MPRIANSLSVTADAANNGFDALVWLATNNVLTFVILLRGMESLRGLLAAFRAASESFGTGEFGNPAK